MPRQRLSPWANFTALSLLFFLVSAGTFSSLGVVLPAMVREMHWSWAQAGLGYTILGLACGLASFTPAFLIRRIGVRGAMLCGSTVLVAGFGSLAGAHAVGTYLIGTMLTGIGFSLVGTVPGTHVLTGLFKRRSTVLGAYFTIGALGGVAGPLLYVTVQSLTHGWRAYWVTFVAAAVLLGVFAIIVTPKGAEVENPEAAPPEQAEPAKVIEGLHDWTVQRALRTVQFYVIVGAYTTYLLVNTTAHGFGVEHLVERGINSRTAAAMMSLEALIGATVSVVGGMLGEKIKPKTLLLVAMVALAIGMTALAEARGLALMLTYAVGMGIGFGLTFLASTVLLFNYFGKRPNLELYSIMCLMSTSAAFGPAIGGWARDAFGGFTPLFLFCSAVAVLMFGASLFMTPPVFDPRRASPLAAESPAE
jgi:MFS family permease